MTEDAFARKFAELAATFRTQLPEKLSELRRLAAAGPDGLDELRAMAHRLAGQGGTFGMPEVTEAARAVETADPAQLPAVLAALADAVGGRH